MKAPLAIYVAYHKDNVSGNLFYDELFKLLCRDTYDLNKNGIGIPIYCRELGIDDVMPIDYDAALKNVVFVLIDVQMYIHKDSTLSYIDKIRKHVDDDNANTLLVPVAMYRYASTFDEQLGRIQYIDAGENFDSRVFKRLELDIYDVLCRFVMGRSGEPIRVFLSHSKRDADKQGEMLAESAKTFINNELRLSTFFDRNNILSAVPFDSQIAQNAKDGVMLVIFSNSYSSRVWCRKEITFAKEAGIPILLLFMVNGDIERVFPYVGNYPAMTFTGDWIAVIKELLRAKLKSEYAKMVLKPLADANVAFDYLTHMPEALNLAKIGKNINQVFYPEPPMPMDEEKMLHSLRPNLNFITPIRYYANKYDLKGMHVAISVSDGENLTAFGIGHEMIREVVLNLTRNILLSGGKLSYGGNLQGDGYTEFFADLLCQYNKQEGNVANITNYISWPLCRLLTPYDVGEFQHQYIGFVPCDADTVVPVELRSKYVAPVTLEDWYYWSRSLTSMRERMVAETKARILISGRCVHFKGQFAGLLEEFLLSYESQQPIYLLGGFGGMANMIGRAIDDVNVVDEIFRLASENPVYSKLLEKHKKEGKAIDYERVRHLTWEGLNNGLAEDESRELFRTTNIPRIIELISKGLSKKNAAE